MSEIKYTKPLGSIFLPLGIQKSRQHKLTSPNSLPIVSVSRPGKWGNPFKLEGDNIYVDISEGQPIKDKWKFLCKGDIDLVMNLYRIVVTGKIKDLKIEFKMSMFKYLSYWTDYFSKMTVTELKNKNLACWCKPGNKCHREILIELANKSE